MNEGIRRMNTGSKAETSVYDQWGKKLLNKFAKVETKLVIVYGEGSPKIQSNKNLVLSLIIFSARQKSFAPHPPSTLFSHPHR